jgi:hypothetical protein
VHNGRSFNTRDRIAPSVMNLRLAGLLFALGLAACSKSPDAGTAGATDAPKTTPLAVAAQAAPAPVAPADADAGIAWRKGDVDAAFAAARAENKPVFL